MLYTLQPAVPILCSRPSKLAMPCHATPWHSTLGAQHAFTACPPLHPPQDIYIARAEGELQLEEELFYLLLKIFKTPALLNQLTRLSQQNGRAV